MAFGRQLAIKSMQNLRRESIQGLTLKHRQENLAWRKAELERRGWSLESVQDGECTWAIFRRNRDASISDFFAEAFEWISTALPIFVGFLALILTSIFFVFARLILLVVLVGIAVRTVGKMSRRV